MKAYIHTIVFQIESAMEKSIFTLHLTFNCVYVYCMHVYTRDEDERNKIREKNVFNCIKMHVKAACMSVV